MKIGGIYIYDGNIFMTSKRFETSDSAYIKVGSNKVMIPEEIRALPGYGCMCPSYFSGSWLAAEQYSRIYFSGKKYYCEAVKLVLTGEEDIDVYSSGSTKTAQIKNVLVGDCQQAVCWFTHGNVNVNSDGKMDYAKAGSASGDRHLYINNLKAAFGFTTEEEFRAFLKEQYATENPVTVIYKYENTYDVSDYIDDAFLEVKADKEISMRRDDDTIDSDAQLILVYRVKIDT